MEIVQLGELGLRQAEGRAAEQAVLHLCQNPDALQLVVRVLVTEHAVVEAAASVAGNEPLGLALAHTPEGGRRETEQAGALSGRASRKAKPTQYIRVHGRGRRVRLVDHDAVGLPYPVVVGMAVNGLQLLDGGHHHLKVVIDRLNLIGTPEPGDGKRPTGPHRTPEVGPGLHRLLTEFVTLCDPHDRADDLPVVMAADDRLYRHTRLASARREREQRPLGLISPQESLHLADELLLIVVEGRKKRGAGHTDEWISGFGSGAGERTRES